MRWLIILVGAMGALIMAGLALLGYGVYQKAASPDTTLPQAAKHMEHKPSPPFGGKDIILPQGCRVEQVIPGGRRLFLHTGPSGSPCERIVIIDATDGTVLGTLDIKQAPQQTPPQIP